MMTLAQYLKRENLTQAQLAERLGASQGAVSKLVSGDRSPSWEMAARIEAVTSGAVPVAVWAQKGAA